MLPLQGAACTLGALWNLDMSPDTNPMTLAYTVYIAVRRRPFSLPLPCHCRPPECNTGGTPPPGPLKEARRVQMWSVRHMHCPPTQ